MLKTFLTSISGNGGDQAAPSDAQDPLDREQFKLIVRAFPIGKKLRYTPEFKNEIVFDTLLVAYCVDGEFIYSRESIEIDAEGYPTAFVLGEQDKRVSIEEVKVFQLLLPDTSDQEKTLDYNRKVLMGRHQFTKGKYLSLISSYGGRGVTTMDTEVVKLVHLKEGPYASAHMVLVAPEPDSLTVIDQRGKTRTKICVPVTVTVDENQVPGTCKLVDFSDSMLQIRGLAGNEPALHKGVEVTLGLHFSELDHQYMIKGTVMRRTADSCVIKLLTYSKGGPFVGFGSLDHVELKAELLNYGI